MYKLTSKFMPCPRYYYSYYDASQYAKSISLRKGTYTIESEAALVEPFITVHINHIEGIPS